MLIVSGAGLVEIHQFVFERLAEFSCDDLRELKVVELGVAHDVVAVRLIHFSGFVHVRRKILEDKEECIGLIAGMDIESSSNIPLLAVDSHSLAILDPFLEHCRVFGALLHLSEIIHGVGDDHRHVVGAPVGNSEGLLGRFGSGIGVAWDDWGPFRVRLISGGGSIDFIGRNLDESLEVFAFPSEFEHSNH